MDNSNNTLRWNRTSKEALGYNLKSWHFAPPSPEFGDKAVFWSCVAIGTVFLAALIAGVKLGG